MSRFPTTVLIPGHAPHELATPINTVHWSGQWVPEFIVGGTVGAWESCGCEGVSVSLSLPLSLSW